MFELARCVEKSGREGTGGGGELGEGLPESAGQGIELFGSVTGFEDEIDGGSDFGVGLDGLDEGKGVALQAGGGLEIERGVVQEGVLAGGLGRDWAGQAGEGGGGRRRVQAVEVGDGAEGKGERVEAMGVGGVPESGVAIEGDDAGDESPGDRVAGGGGEGEGFVGEVELPVVGRDGAGIEEAEERGGGKLRRGGSGEFGECEELGIGGAPLGGGVGREGGGGE
jgi:hypothetical protein